MTAAINIFVAAILIARAWRAAHRFEGGLLPGEHLLIFLLMTGMFQTGGFELGINLSAWRLLIWIVLVGLVLVKSGPAMPRLTAADLPIVFYGVFLLWCIFRLVGTPSASYGVRNLLKVVYPFLVLVLARRAARHGHLGVYLVPMIGAVLIISIFTSGLSEKVPYLVYNPLLYGVFWPRATFADHAAIMVGVILIVLWIYKGRMPVLSRRIYTVGVIWLILSPLAVASRTGLLATAAAISGYAVARYRVKALPMIGGLFLLGVAVFVFVPQVRANTFYTTDDVEFSGILRGEVDTSNIDSSGRFAMWEDLLDRFYRPDPLMGSGLGAVQSHLYTKAAIDGGLQAAHSDYVTLLCDTGLVGLLLYLSVALSAVCLAARYVWAGPTVELRAGAALVLVSFLASLCATGFDNVFNYTLPVHSLPFAFTGILLGMVTKAPSFTTGNPWLWSWEYVWSRLLPMRRPRFEPRPQAPPAWTNLYARNRIRMP
jgi:hypothetical protein